MSSRLRLWRSDGILGWGFIPTNTLAHLVGEGCYIIGDGAGTSLGITAAGASGIRAAEGIMGE